MADTHDYYEILGVEVEASHTDIRRSYRILAMRYHPDQNPTPEAEERFKLITQAYRVLIDPKRRATYDRLRSGDRNMAQPRSPRAARSGASPQSPEMAEAERKRRPWWEDDPAHARQAQAPPHSEELDLQVDVTINGRTAEFGGQEPLAVTRQEPCATCGGTGAKPGTVARGCPECDPRAPSPTCRLCSGRGHLVQVHCPSCLGACRIRTTKTVEVQIPPHARDKQKLIVPGEGLIGKDGRCGDLLVRLHVKAGAEYERRGNDTYSEIQITPNLAAFGGKVRVKTVDSAVDLSVPPGTRSGTVFRLEGMGPRIRGNERGDHFVTIKIITP